MKVIFLDFDGVMINTGDGKSPNLFDFCGAYCSTASTEAVEALNYIIECTGAVICVTSKWRYGCSLMELQDTVTEWKVDGTVISKTPVRYQMERGTEIQEWLDNHYVESFVILDDAEKMLHLEEYRILIDPEIGLTMKDAEKAIQLLGEIKYMEAGFGA